MHLRDLMDAMEKIAPLRDAEPWDNVGLILGDAAAQVRRVLLCIDLTADVVEEAVRDRCDAVVAYHPPIFKDLRKVVADAGRDELRDQKSTVSRSGGATATITASSPGAIVFEALRHGIAVYSPHTALDVADGGTNDVLAEAMGLKNAAPLRLSPPGEDLKLVTFVPTEAAEKVADALFAAGAGQIGDYRECSFMIPGTGTFYAEEGANPAVGQKGRRERVAEVRLETLVPEGKAEAVVAALMASHPYEEPAFDLLKRALPPQARGMGRIGNLEEPVARDILITRIKHELDVGHVLLAGPMHGLVRRAACCAGSCGDLMDLAAARGAELYLTGELKHHDALRAMRLGMTVVCVLHSNSERAVLKRVREKLAEMLKGVEVRCCEADCDPFSIV